MQLRTSNRQDYVFFRPPGISAGGFQLRIGNVWFCKVLLLFSMISKTDQGPSDHACAFVSAREDAVQVALCALCALCALYTFCALIALIALIVGWLDQTTATMVFERKPHLQRQVLYVIPVSSILGRLLLVPFGDTGTIPFSMLGLEAETQSFPGPRATRSRGKEIYAGFGLSTRLQCRGQLKCDPLAANGSDSGAAATAPRWSLPLQQFDKWSGRTRPFSYTPPGEY